MHSVVTRKQNCFNHAFYCPRTRFVLICFHCNSLLLLNSISVVMPIHQGLCYYRNNDFMLTVFLCRLINIDNYFCDFLCSIFPAYYLSESFQCVVYLHGSSTRLKQNKCALDKRPVLIVGSDSNPPF